MAIERRLRNGVLLGLLVVVSLLGAAILNLHPPPSSAKPSATPIDESNLPEVVASVNDKKITRTFLLATLSADYDQSKRNDQTFRQALDDIISRELLAEQVAAEKITVDPSEVDQAVAHYREHLGDAQAYADMLKESGETEEQVRGDFTRKLSVTKLLDEHVRTKVTITEEDAKKYYDQNPRKFLVQSDIHLADIVLKLPPQVREDEFQARHAEAEKILAEAKAGKDFAALARAHSEDPVSAARGGDVGVFHPGQLPAEVEMAAGELRRPGDLSGVVETQTGLHILRLLETHSEHRAPFEEVRDTIMQSLRDKAVAETAQGYVSQLRRKATVKVYF